MKDPIGDRMKSFYESRSKTCLIRRTPIIIRIDGRSFSKFCKRFEKPYDDNLHRMLNSVMLFLCKNIQGAKFAERHSDEISILVTDYDKITTDAFFDYEVQKICSITASMATSAFTKELIMSNLDNGSLMKSWPQFDSRCFNIPENEIANYFYWRILDAKRNSVGMHAATIFSHKELHRVSCDKVKSMMLEEKNFSWDDLPQERKTGFICVKRSKKEIIHDGPNKGEECQRLDWAISPSFCDVNLIKEEIDFSLSVKK